MEVYNKARPLVPISPRDIRQDRSFTIVLVLVRLGAALISGTYTKFSGTSIKFSVSSTQYFGAINSNAVDL